MINVPVTEYKANLQTGQITSGSLQSPLRPMTMKFISKSGDDYVNTDIKYLYHIILPPQEIAAAKDCFKFDLDGREYKGKTYSTLKLTSGKRAAIEMTMNFTSPIIK